MAQNLLTVGIGETSSTDFVLDGQKEATLSIRGNNTTGNVPSNTLIYIELKDDAGNYWPINILNSSQKLVLLNAVGTYRVRRSATSGEAGVFYELGDTAGSGGGGGGTTNGLTDAQLRASAVPVSLASQPLPTGASTEATLSGLSNKLPGTLGSKASASSLSIVVASDQIAFPVNTLAMPSTARQLTAAASTGSSANIALTSTVRRISIKAVGSAMRYAIGSTAPTASATSHYIGQDERLDIAVPATPYIAVLSASTTAGVLEITELV